MLQSNKRLIVLLLSAALLLLVPLIAMQFTHEVDWGLSDFFVAALLLYGTVLLIELVLRKVKNPWHRLVVCLAVLLVLLLLWAELAVGVFGSPLAGN